MPLDAKPEKRIVIKYDTGCPNASGEEYADVVDTYTSHFATCKNAAQHRRPR